MTKQEILTIASSREFAVNKYGEGHAKLRKLTRRLWSDGELVMVMQNNKQFFYRTPDTALDTDYGRAPR